MAAALALGGIVKALQRGCNSLLLTEIGQRARFRLRLRRWQARGFFAQRADAFSGQRGCRDHRNREFFRGRLVRLE